MTKVKICGITNLQDALFSAKAGCDALGFMFYKKSPRYIRPEDAAQIIKKIPKNVIKIGVFVNSQEAVIRKIAKLCLLNILQFHGNESADFCRRFKDYKVIKVFRIKDRIDLDKISKYKTFAYLFDSFAKSKFGGTGISFNWKLLEHLSGIKQAIFLAGGINCNNVLEAIKTAHPDWVDASSSLELSPGKKDHIKVKKFIHEAKNATR